MRNGLLAACVGLGEKFEQEKTMNGGIEGVTTKCTAERVWEGEVRGECTRVSGWWREEREMPGREEWRRGWQ